MIDEVDYQIGMERAPLIVPLQHITSSDGPKNFLNFEERALASLALETLAKYPDQVSNLRSLFQVQTYKSAVSFTQHIMFFKNKI